MTAQLERHDGPVHASLEGSSLLVRLNRPDVLNAMTHELMDDLRAVCELNPRTCFVDLDVPAAADRVDFAPCVITSYDQTASAIRAICKALRG